MTDRPRRTTAIERAREDVARGDHWLARKRLHSVLHSRGYDPELLAEMGRVSYEMHDTFDAGRNWLVSSATGPEVDKAIECFVRHAGGTPAAIVSHLSHQTRLSDCKLYPEMVQERLQKFGVIEAIQRKPSRHRNEVPSGWLLSSVFFLLLILGVITLVAGTYTIINEIVQWIF